MRHCAYQLACHEAKKNAMIEELSESMRRSNANMEIQYKKLSSMNVVLNTVQRSLNGLEELFKGADTKIHELNHALDNVHARIADAIKLMDESVSQEAIDKHFSFLRERADCHVRHGENVAQNVYLYIESNRKILDAELVSYQDRAAQLASAVEQIHRTWYTDRKLQRGLKALEQCQEKLSIIIAAIAAREKILPTLIGTMKVTPDKLRDIYHNLRVLDAHYSEHAASAHDKQSEDILYDK